MCVAMEQRKEVRAACLHQAACPPSSSDKIRDRSSLFAHAAMVDKISPFHPPFCPYSSLFADIHHAAAPVCRAAAERATPCPPPAWSFPRHARCHYAISFAIRHAFMPPRDAAAEDDPNRRRLRHRTVHDDTERSAFVARCRSLSTRREKKKKKYASSASTTSDEPLPLCYFSLFTPLFRFCR